MIDATNILNEEMSLMLKDIVNRIDASGQNTTGNTKKSLELKVESNHGQLSGAKYIGVMERGRKPGKVPKDFVDILKRWIVAKGLSFNGEKDLERFANAIKWKIIKEGTSLYASKKTVDIFTTPIDEFSTRLTNRLAEFYEIEVTNEIFNK